MQSIIDKTYRVIAQLPAEEEIKSDYRKKASKMYNECGCSMGGITLVAAFAGIVLYWVFISHAWNALLKGVAVIFLISLAGKLTGIAIGRVRLFALYIILSRKITH